MMMNSCDEENECESCEILSTLQLPQFLLSFFIHLRLHKTFLLSFLWFLITAFYNMIKYKNHAAAFSCTLTGINCMNVR